MKTLFMILTLLLNTQTTYAMGAPQPNLTVQSHTASEMGFLVNSHLILGQKEAILIDAQFTRSEAAKVVRLIKQSGRNLKLVYITHSHPDHYFGLEIILQAFPKAKAVALAKTVKEIKETFQGKLSYWKPIYKEELVDKPIIPEVLKSKQLVLEGQILQLVSLGLGESGHDSVVYLPAQKILLSGDVIYGDVHLWIAENHVQEWKQNIKKLKHLQIAKVYSGHGESGTKELLNENLNYLLEFEKALEKPNLDLAKIQILEKFPNYRLPIILDIALNSVQF